MSKVWLITGCSSGFGREIALAAARRGDTVVATARDVSRIEDLEKLGLKIVNKRLDVLDSDEQVKETIADVVKTLGRIDILVNNAGYILEGAIEECSTDEVQKCFATNVFSQMTLIRAVAPYMRAQGSGTIANLGSIAGWNGTPSAGVYCATKAAIAMYTESLRVELAPFGIDVTSIEPGYFRTQFLTSGNRTVAHNRIPELSSTTDHTKRQLDAYNKKQPGDPVKGAAVIVQALTKSGVCEGRELPVRLPLGKDAVRYINESLRSNKQALDDWEAVVSCTNCDDVE
ncbi:dehydrogenase/reductase SDR family member 7B [Nannizzia gypsea CBS 118893]|uniref:Dehydrogenase/reductase SDR family member 7B n=1 Tax=Arthroderma gypseum (strain ATCC MYA-4604 / CBS 118893) TaxID=535722 RepID=E4V6U5_ARTGP|nr:dehydrogenase/reductase SDR family member 7B [Nannizzia gypsea CBS 118893]EFQ96811.1 dehydrogenase/reductase SDR family member 7B [Nannizzia gypsea CBS 118893]